MKNYRSSIILLLCVIVGGTLGYTVPAVAPYLAPIGKIFLNLLLVMIVPLVFFSVSSSICQLSNRSALGKTLWNTTWIAMLILVLLSSLTYLVMLIIPPVAADTPIFQGTTITEQKSIGDLLVDALTVTDFAMLFSVRHILPLMLISVLLGIAVSRLHSDNVAKALQRCQDVVSQMMNCLMLLAPVGLGCYFADIMAHSDMTLVGGYSRTFGIFLLMTAVVYILINPLLGIISGIGLKNYWRETTTPALLAISSLSSSACIPANIEASKRMGSDPTLAESIVPLGTQLYKQGSGISCVIKVGFVMMLCGSTLWSIESFLVVLTVSIFASMIVGAVPTGAGTAELFICSVLGAPAEMVGLLMVISTLVDMPATLLNVNGNTILPSLVGKAQKANK